MKVICIMFCLLFCFACEEESAGENEQFSLDGFEVTSAQCSDLQDNDGDGEIDCEDKDCEGFIFCSSEYSDSDTDSDTDSDADGDTDSDADGDADEDVPQFTWVLRDNTGKAQLGQFYPHYSNPTEPFTENNPDCAYVAYWGEIGINIYYDLDTGSPYDCPYYESASDWRTLSNIIFLDSECSGQPYINSLLAGSYKFVVNNSLYYGDVNGTNYTPASYYTWDSNTAGCGELENTASFTFVPLAIIPSWVENLLSAPPYTLEIEF